MVASHRPSNCHPTYTVTRPPLPPMLCPPQVIFWICVAVWLINYHHFLVLHWVENSPIPDLASSTFNLAKCTYYFKVRQPASQPVSQMGSACCPFLGHVHDLELIEIDLRPGRVAGAHFSVP